MAGGVASEDTETVTMTRAELRRMVDESFINGTKAALETLGGVVRDFTARVDAAVPGWLEADAKTVQADQEAS